MKFKINLDKWGLAHLTQERIEEMLGKAYLCGKSDSDLEIEIVQEQHFNKQSEQEFNGVAFRATVIDKE